MNNKTFTRVALTAIILFSTAAHFWRISYPSTPVFDEAHFATYASNYVQGRAFFDIHPPLGKLVYAGTLAFVLPKNFAGTTQFVHIALDPATQKVRATPTGAPFGDFPYVPLRITDAVIGILLPLVMYAFLKSIGIHEVPSLLGASFVALENSLIVDTRLILLNGMYLTLGFGALALYFKKHSRSVTAGVVWGLAIGVKLIAVIFLGPVIMSALLAHWTKENDAAEKRSATKFFLVGIAVLLSISLFNPIFFRTADRIEILRSFEWIRRETAASWLASPIAGFGLSAATEAGGMLVGYLGKPFGTLTHHANNSPWYAWPFMQAPILFSEETAGDALHHIVLFGNPVLWLGGTCAVIVAFATLARSLKKFWRDKKQLLQFRPLCIVLGGYVATLLPYALLVRRSTFIYHYFPALIFSLGLLAWFLAQWLKLDTFEKLDASRAAAIAFIVFVSVLGFAMVAPLTYGL